MSLNNESPKMTPAVRAAGFTGDWEQRKLSGLFETQSRPINMEANSEYELVTVKRRNGGVVSRGKFKGNEVLVKSQFELRSGDFLISKRQVVHGATGIVPRSLDGAIVSNEYLVLRGNSMLNTDFFRILSERPQMYLLYFLSSYGIDIEKLVFNVRMWMNKEILIPSLNEQLKNCTLIQKLDDTVISHQHKLSGLQQARSWAEQNLFPTSNKITPKVRVDEFDGAWTSTNIGDICKEIKDRSANGELLSVTRHNGVVRFSETGRKDNSSNDKSNYKWVSKGDLVYNSMRMWQGASGLSKYDGIVSPAYTVVKLEPTVDGNFISLLFKNDPLVFIFRRHSKGLTSDTWNLKYPELSKIRISYPSLAEQQAIAKVFTTIDARIKSEQQLIADLQEVKRWALDNMFV